MMRHSPKRSGNVSSLSTRLLFLLLLGIGSLLYNFPSFMQ